MSDDDQRVVPLRRPMTIEENQRATVELLRAMLALAERGTFVQVAVLGVGPTGAYHIQQHVTDMVQMRGLTEYLSDELRVKIRVNLEHNKR